MSTHVICSCPIIYQPYPLQWDKRVGLLRDNVDKMFEVGHTSPDTETCS